MSRVKRGTVSRKRHKKLFKQTKGFWGQRKNVFRRAQETLLRALAFAFKGRKLKKRDFIFSPKTGFGQIGRKDAQKKTKQKKQKKTKNKKQKTKKQKNDLKNKNFQNKPTFNYNYNHNNKK